MIYEFGRSIDHHPHAAGDGILRNANGAVLMDLELLEKRLAEVQRKWGYVVVASPVSRVVGSCYTPNTLNLITINPENGDINVHIPVRFVSETTAEEYAEQRRFMGLTGQRDMAGWYFYRVETD